MSVHNNHSTEDKVMNATTKQIVDSVNTWNVAGVSRDLRSIQIRDSDGRLVALIPFSSGDAESKEKSEVLASLISATGKLYATAESVLGWGERTGVLPRAIERKLISSLAKAKGRI